MRDLTNEDLDGLSKMKKDGVKQFLGVNPVLYHDNRKYEQKQKIKEKKRKRFDWIREMAAS